jgi:hypothetical protein
VGSPDWFKFDAKNAVAAQLSGNREVGVAYSAVWRFDIDGEVLMPITDAAIVELEGLRLQYVPEGGDTTSMVLSMTDLSHLVAHGEKWRGRIRHSPHSPDALTRLHTHGK